MSNVTSNTRKRTPRIKGLSQHFLSPSKIYINKLSEFKLLNAFHGQLNHYTTGNPPLELRHWLQTCLGISQSTFSDLERSVQHVVSARPNRPMGKFLICVGHWEESEKNLTPLHVTPSITTGRQWIQHSESAYAVWTLPTAPYLTNCQQFSRERWRREFLGGPEACPLAKFWNLGLLEWISSILEQTEKRHH